MLLTNSRLLIVEDRGGGLAILGLSCLESVGNQLGQLYLGHLLMRSAWGYLRGLWTGNALTFRWQVLFKHLGTYACPMPLRHWVYTTSRIEKGVSTALIVYRLEITSIDDDSVGELACGCLRSLSHWLRNTFLHSCMLIGGLTPGNLLFKRYALIGVESTLLILVLI